MVEVHFDFKKLQDNVNRILGKKIDVIHYTNTKDELAGLYAMYISKYVPYKSGKLFRSAKVNHGAVVYSAKARRPRGNFDYASIQYYIPFPQSSRSTPYTYDHWNRHLTSAERQAFYEDAAKIITKEMNNAR